MGKPALILPQNIILLGNRLEVQQQLRPVSRCGLSPGFKTSMNAIQEDGDETGEVLFGVTYTLSTHVEVRSAYQIPVGIPEDIGSRMDRKERTIERPLRGELKVRKSGVTC